MRSMYIKKKSGITLIALVITIIVLMILSGVAISMVLNGGILNKAQTATEQYSQEQIRENVQQLLAEYATENYTKNINLEDYLNKMKKEGKIDNVEKNQDSNYIITLGENYVIINEEQEIIDIQLGKNEENKDEENKDEESFDTENLVDYWPLTDSLSNRVTTSTTGDLITSQGNIRFIDGAAFFSDTVISTNGNYTMPEEYTVKLEYKPTEVNVWTVIFGKQNGYAYNSNFTFLFIDNNNPNSSTKLGFYSGANDYKLLNFNETFNINEWNNIKITYDKTNLKLFVNDVEKTSISGYTDITSALYIGGGIYSGSTVVGANWGYANGYFRNLAIYEGVK